jgi:DNA repair protein RecO (recombination protein O)
MPHSETSRIIQWITEDHGRCTTIAKGALRPRNALLGQIDLFYTCEIVYYARPHDHGGVAILREAAPLHTRPRFRTDWRAAAAAGYAMHILVRILPDHDPAPRLYHLLASLLNEWNERGWYAPALFAHELRLLQQLGLTPRLEQCAGCGTPISPASPPVFSIARGGLVCPHCRPPGDDTRQPGADVVAMLRHWQNAEGWNSIRATRATPRQLQNAGTLLGDFLAHHLDVHPAARETVLNRLFASPVTAQNRLVTPRSPP